MHGSAWSSVGCPIPGQFPSNFRPILLSPAGIIRTTSPRLVGTTQGLLSPAAFDGCPVSEPEHGRIELLYSRGV